MSRSVRSDEVNSLQRFQQFSRLHFIGQWKTKMDDLFAEWFAERPEWCHGQLSHQLLYIHIDMDAFFCSVQLAKAEYAALRDKPVGIAAGRYNSDISSCNYVARSMGVRAGMYVNAAKALCPDLVTLGYDLPACEAVAKTLYRVIFEAFLPSVNMSVEVYSIDEVMIATDTNDYDVLEEFCQKVRSELANATGCTASCGIGPNIMLARLSTSKAKPDGVCVCRREEVAALMQSLPFSSIHGAGESTIQRVHALLVERRIISEMTPPNELTCGHTQQLSKDDLQTALGRKAGESFYYLSRGQDSRVVSRTGDRENQRALGKSIPVSLGCSMNYAVRPACLDDVWNITAQIVDDVRAKMRRNAVTAQGFRVTLLERHPLHPKETVKYMGRGKCVEVHLPVRFPHALEETARDVMLAEVQKVVVPLLVDSRSISDQERAVQLGLAGEDMDGQMIWTSTLEHLTEIVIGDIRGMTVQATGLRAIGELPIVHKIDSGQLLLADAFSRSTAHARRGGNRQKSTTAIPSVGPKIARVEVALSPAMSGGEPDQGQTLPLMTHDKDVNRHELPAGAPSISLYSVTLLTYGDDFIRSWTQGCEEACARHDYPLVKAYIRCATLKIAEAHSLDEKGARFRELVAGTIQQLHASVAFL